MFYYSDGELIRIEGLKVETEKLLHISQAIMRAPRKGSLGRVCACLDCVTNT